VAYVRGGKDNWYLNGPSIATKRKSNGFAGMGQTCPTGFSMDATGVCSQQGCDFGYELTAAGVCTTSTTIISGIPDIYIFAGVAGFAVLMLFGAERR
jgi:hypothetical protein